MTVTTGLKPLLFFPCNGNAIEALDCLSEEHHFHGFIDDNPGKPSPHPLLGRDALARYPEAKVLAVPGSPSNHKERHEIIASLGVPPERFATVIHPSAHIGRSVKIGYNCLILAGVVITSNAVIGNHVCILPGSVIHHDAVIGDYTLIGGNVAITGTVRVGRNCYIATGANVIHGITIGDFTLVGLGSNVIRSVPPHSKIVGNPARQIPLAALLEVKEPRDCHAVPHAVTRGGLTFASGEISSSARRRKWLRRLIGRR